MRTLESSERGLHPMQYAMKICEDLGMPGVRTNLESIGMAIEAISKGRMFRGRPDAVEVAFLWLHRRTMTAEEQGAKITHLWFRDAEYKNVSRPEGARGDYNNCDSACKTRHGKGYDYNDVKWVMHHYLNEVKAGGTRTPWDLFKELDGKREGGPPEWRHGS